MSSPLRDMMKADRMALLLVAIALLVAGCVLGVRSCREAGATTGGEPVVIIDTVYKPVHRLKSDTDSIKAKKKSKKKKEKKPKPAPKPPRPRDYSSDIIPPVN